MTGPEPIAGRVSIVVVTWQSRDLVETAIATAAASVRAAGLEPEVVVVDNASSDGTADHLAAVRPDVTLVRSATNEGFGRANNRAFERCTGEVWLLVNPDARVDAAAVGALVAFLRAHPGAGAAAPAIDGPGAAESAGMLPSVRSAIGHFLFLNRLLPGDRGGAWRGFQLRRQPPGTAVEVEWASAAVLALRPSAVRAVGGFDPSIFLYGEDTDLAVRLRAAGWRIWLLTSARAWHAIGASSGSGGGEVSTRWLDGLDEWLRRRGVGAARRAAFHIVAAAGLFLRAIAARPAGDPHVRAHRRRLRSASRRAVELAARSARS